MADAGPGAETTAWAGAGAGPALLPLHGPLGAALGGAIPVFIVSLQDATDRRAVLLERGVPRDWVEAFLPAADMRGADDARMRAEAEVAAMEAQIGRAVRAGEIGCSLSHRNAGSWLARSGHAMALVLEDDVIPQMPDWIARVQATAQALARHAAGGAAFICLLGATRYQGDRSLTRPVRWQGGMPPAGTPEVLLHVDPLRKVWRSHAYLISREAVRRSSAAETKILTLTDDWIERRRRGWLDEVMFTRPILIGQDEDIPSSIGARARIGGAATAPVSAPAWPVRKLARVNEIATRRFRLLLSWGLRRFLPHRIPLGSDRPGDGAGPA